MDPFTGGLIRLVAMGIGKLLDSTESNNDGYLPHVDKRTPEQKAAGSEVHDKQNLSEVYTDPQTGLMWFKNADVAGRALFRGDAMNYIKDFYYGGYSDWRQPTKEEFELFIKERSWYHSHWFNDNGFSNVKPNFYWSSSNTENTNIAWYFQVNTGCVDGYIEAVRAHVWPVRSSK